MARSTRAAVSGRTPDSALTTRETVMRLTPAAVATSRMVGRLFTIGRPLACASAASPVRPGPVSPGHPDACMLPAAAPCAALPAPGWVPPLSPASVSEHPAAVYGPPAAVPSWERYHFVASKTLSLPRCAPAPAPCAARCARGASAHDVKA